MFNYNSWSFRLDAGRPRADVLVRNALQEFAIRTLDWLNRLAATLPAISLLALAPPHVAAQRPEGKSPGQVNDWVYIQNADLRVGFLRSHGGALAHLSARNSEFNALNHYDHGRLVQQSYYGDEDGSRWADKPWRYNAVQGGDYHGNAAKLVAFTSTDTNAYARTVPRHWASGRLLEDCMMEQWATLDGPMLRVRFQFDYGDSRTHQPRHQETPAVFVAPGLKTLVTYSGARPWTDAESTQRLPGWPNERVVLSECWAAYVGDDGKGVGVYVPGVSEATCYRYRGGAGSDCSYIAPLRTFALTPGLSFSYSAYFTLGTAETIRARFKELRGTRAEYFE